MLGLVAHFPTVVSEGVCGPEKVSGRAKHMATTIAHCEAVCFIPDSMSSLNDDPLRETH